MTDDLQSADVRFEAWRAKQESRACACGCGEPIELKPTHRHRGVPEYRPGHQPRKHTHWRGRELAADWAARQQPQPCQCGCGANVPVAPHHRKHGVPKFLRGHQQRVRRSASSIWLEENRGKHFCHCGCGLPIELKVRHFTIGVPRYRQDHAPPPRLEVGAAHPCFIPDRSRVAKPKAFPPSVKRLIAELQGHRCAWCGELELLDIDHIVPASLGGEPTLENAQGLCPTCHRWKTALEWTPRWSRTAESRKRTRREKERG